MPSLYRQWVPMVCRHANVFKRTFPFLSLQKFPVFFRSSYFMVATWFYVRHHLQQKRHNCLTHSRPVFQPSRNVSIDLHSRSIEYFAWWVAELKNEFANTLTCSCIMLSAFYSHSKDVTYFGKYLHHRCLKGP